MKKVFSLVIMLVITITCTAQTSAVHSVTLTWDAVSTPVPNGVFNVYRAPFDTTALTCGVFVKLGNTGAITFTDTTVIASLTYCFDVRYFDPATSSESPSNPLMGVGPIPATIALAKVTGLHMVKIQ